MNRIAAEANPIDVTERPRRPVRTPVSVMAVPVPEGRARLAALVVTLLPWVAALLPLVLLAVLPSIPGPGIDSDDYAQYLMHAQALAAGHPYGDILYLYSPLNPWVGPALAPPGLPLLLAPVLRFGGAGAVPFFMLVIAACMLLLVGRYLVEQDERGVALGTVLLLGLPPALVFAATQPLTDLPFTALVWAMAIAADRPGRPSGLRILALIALGGAALSLRSAAVALPPTLLAVAWLRRREGGWRLAVPVLAWGVVGAAAALVLDFRRVLLVRIHLSGVLAMLAPDLLLLKLRTYGGAFMDAQLQPLPAGWPAHLYHLVATALMVVGAVAWVRRHPRSFLNVFTVVYGAMLIVLPFRDERYFWPLVPLVLFLMVKGIRVTTARFLAPATASRVAVGVVLALALAAGLDTAREPRPVALGETPRGQELFGFLRRTAAREPMRVIFAKPRMIAWELGIPAMGAFSSSEAHAHQALCDRGITHVIVSDLVRDGFMSRLAAEHPRDFTRVFSNGKYMVYRYTAACGAASATPPPIAARAVTDMR